MDRFRHPLQFAAVAVLKPRSGPHRSVVGS